MSCLQDNQVMKLIWILPMGGDTIDRCLLGQDRQILTRQPLKTTYQMARTLVITSTVFAFFL